MALALALQEGRSFYVGDVQISVERIIAPYRYKIRVHGAIDTIMEVSDRERVEVLPDVFISAGHPWEKEGSGRWVKAIIEAPMSIKILRSEIYGK